MTVSALWLATVSLIAGVQGAPNYQLSTSGIAIPQGSEALDNGEIVVRVQRWVVHACEIEWSTHVVFVALRIDDIFSGDIEHQAASKLLLEKKTHIVLRVSLDQAQQTVNVNDQPVYRHFETLGDLDNAAPVSVVKAEVRTRSSAIAAADVSRAVIHYTRLKRRITPLGARSSRSPFPTLAGYRWRRSQSGTQAADSGRTSRSGDAFP